jgi:L-ascorbate metabolism protein UlaG (beta-lactamase superfamily)
VTSANIRTMEITYIGHSCFKIKGKDLTIIIDPYDPDDVGYKLPKLEADVLLISHEHLDHNYREGVAGYRLLIDAPGEYETGGTFIYGIETFHDKKAGSERGKNIMYLIEIDGFNILHTGDLGHELSKETLEKIPNVDVLLVAVGGMYTINAEGASDIISELEPGIVVPMHYYVNEKDGKMDKLDKFLDEMGSDGKAKREEKLKLTTKNDIPEETTVVVLEPQY